MGSWYMGSYRAETARCFRILPSYRAGCPQTSYWLLISGQGVLNHRDGHRGPLGPWTPLMSAPDPIFFIHVASFVVITYFCTDKLRPNWFMSKVSVFFLQNVSYQGIQVNLPLKGKVQNFFYMWCPPTSILRICGDFFYLEAQVKRIAPWKCPHLYTLGPF